MLLITTLCLAGLCVQVQMCAHHSIQVEVGQRTILRVCFPPSTVGSEHSTQVARFKTLHGPSTV